MWGKYTEKQDIFKIIVKMQENRTMWQNISSISNVSEI
jgi:hypothetical protein